MPWLVLLLACGPSDPTPTGPRALEAWEGPLHLHPEERPAWPPGTPTALEGEATQLGEHAVRLEGHLRAVDRSDCPPWPLPPLVQREGRFTSARALPPIAQRLQLDVDPAQSLVRAERVIDTPLTGPSLGHWPAAWTLEADVGADGRRVELPREGNTVLWPTTERLVLAGDGPLPSPNRLDEQGMALAIADLVPDRRATRTGLAVVGSSFYLEPDRGQRVEGNELLVAGVRFPHHAGRDGIRVLANDARAEAMLEGLLALRAVSSFPWPRPLFVVPGPRDARFGDYLALGPDAWAHDDALRRASWHLAPMDAPLRRSFQALERPATPLEDPGCFGLRSRPELDRSRLLAQVLLRDPQAATASSWAELERRHPWLTPWLDAPAFPTLARRREGDQVRWVDTAGTGLPLRIPVRRGEEREVIEVGEAIDGESSIDPEARLPAHR